MTSIYLIYYDNGESYEDHRSYPVLAAPTKKRAEEILAEMNAGVKRAKAKCPQPADYDSPDHEQRYEKREAYVKSLKPPYDVKELVGMATDEYCTDQALRAREIRVV